MAFGVLKSAAGTTFDLIAGALERIDNVGDLAVIWASRPRFSMHFMERLKKPGLASKPSTARSRSCELISVKGKQTMLSSNSASIRTS